LATDRQHTGAIGILTMTALTNYKTTTHRTTYYDEAPYLIHSFPPMPPSILPTTISEAAILSRRAWEDNGRCVVRGCLLMLSRWCPTGYRSRLQL